MLAYSTLFGNCSHKQTMSSNSTHRDANSGDKSRRSRDNSVAASSASLRSNNSGGGGGGGGNRSKKQKKSDQKTLGMAWGSNSVSSSRSSSRASPFSDFGHYMAEKNRKLQEQFQTEASTSSHADSKSWSPIFNGVSIFVDGFTIPSSQELRGYMLKYGGRYENYFSRHHVTHIICSNLPDTKIKNLRSFSGGLPVVKPKWILDSVATGKLLSWVPYKLDQLADNQPTLSAFFAQKCVSESKDVSSTACQVHDVGDSSLGGGILKGASSYEVADSMKCGSQIGEGSNEKNVDSSAVMESVKPSGIFCGADRSEPIDVAGEEKVIFGEELDGLLSEPSTSATDHSLNRTIARSSPRSGVPRPSNKGHSTLGDANFVENYFKNSRLHFIGTWRHRYRKRFPSSGYGIKLASCSLKASDDSLKTSIIHIDMDCFFVSVVIRNLPELQDKPVAICHSDNPKGTAEISSANYPARNYGICAGMFVRDAKALCPELTIFPYNFEAYEEVADHFYDILHKHCKRVQAVSCDEAFLDVSDSESAVQEPQLLASIIRREIFETTGCTASAGIAGNMLMARLATKTAKPNSQHFIPLDKVDDYLHELPINALPGIGHVLEDKLKKQNVSTCGQLRMMSKDSLQKEFGTKTGDMLWNYSRGIDNRLVGAIQETKSIGAEVNWGVRFNDAKDSKQFLVKLCKEVHLRLQGCGLQGRKFTLKIKKRKKDADEPAKYMGCGDCENLSHTITVPVAIDDIEVIQRVAMQLFGSFHIDVREVRGVGLQVSRLESADSSKQGLERNLLKSWLASSSATLEDRGDIIHNAEQRKALGAQSIDGASGNLSHEVPGNHNQVDMSSSDCGTFSDRSLNPPPICHLDMEVIQSLPSELFSELNDAYGGKLVAFISEGKGKSKYGGDGNNSGNCLPMHLHEVVRGVKDGAKEGFLHISHAEKFQLTEKPLHQEAEVVPAPGLFNVAASVPTLRQTDLMPSSLSQVDSSVLRQLPEGLRDSILELLPAHRGQGVSQTAPFSSDAAIVQEPSTPRRLDNRSGLDNSETELWMGDPPHWVDKYRVSNCLILNILAELYHRSGEAGNLSASLQRFISEFSSHLDILSNDWDEATCSLSELLKQYIKLKVEMDIEEIFICFRLVKRLAVKSKLFLQVQNITFPYLQEKTSSSKNEEEPTEQKD